MQYSLTRLSKKNQVILLMFVNSALTSDLNTIASMAASKRAKKITKSRAKYWNKNLHEIISAAHFHNHAQTQKYLLKIIIIIFYSYALTFTFTLILNIVIKYFIRHWSLWWCTTKLSLAANGPAVIFWWGIIVILTSKMAKAIFWYDTSPWYHVWLQKVLGSEDTVWVNINWNFKHSLCPWHCAQQFSLFTRIMLM